MIIIIPFEKGIPPRYNLYDKIKVILVKMWTKSIYFHSEFISGDRWITANTDGIQGIKLHPLEDRYDYIFIDIPIVEYHQQVLFQFMEDQIGQEYDWVGIYLSQFISLGVNSSNKWFCSELSTKLLQLCLLEEVLELQPHKISPDQLFSILSGVVDEKRAYFRKGEDVVGRTTKDIILELYKEK